MISNVKRQLLFVAIITILAVMTIPAMVFADDDKVSNPDSQDRDGHFRSHKWGKNKSGRIATPHNNITDGAIKKRESSMHSRSITPFSTMNVNVTVSKSSKTKIKYAVTGSLTSKADRLIVRAVKCIRNSSGNWVPSGSSTTKSYSKTKVIKSSGKLSCKSKKNYKVRITITEKRGSDTKTTMRYSKTI